MSTIFNKLTDKNKAISWVLRYDSGVLVNHQEESYLIRLI